MKRQRRHRPAGDMRDVVKAIEKEIVDSKEMLDKLNDAEANQYLPEEPSTSVPLILTGRTESKRRKF